jgi:hypothetical protein
MIKGLELETDWYISWRYASMPCPRQLGAIDYVAVTAYIAARLIPNNTVVEQVAANSRRLTLAEETEGVLFSTHTIQTHTLM